MRISKYIIDKIRKMGGARTFVFWGYSDFLIEELKAEDIDIKYVFTGNNTLLAKDSDFFKPVRTLNQRSNDFFVILPFWQKDKVDWQKEKLEGWGFRQNIDYFAVQPEKEIVVEDSNVCNLQNNNSVVGFSKNMKIHIWGFDNEISMEDIIADNLSISINGSNNRVMIHSGAKFIEKTTIRIKGSNQLIEIGANTRFTKLFIKTFGDTNLLSIGEGSTFEKNIEFVLHSFTSIMIGKDCMISFDNVFQAGDGHSIFDIVTGKNVNSALDNLEKEEFYNSIVVEDHVWFGRRCTVLGGNTIIREGTIVGACSFVKGKYLTNNVIIAGIPARIIKRNVAWSRKNRSKSIEDCGEYIKMSNEDTSMGDGLRRIYGK